MQQDFVALQWVLGDIEQSADQLTRTLLGYADNLSEPTRLRTALTQAHQVHATLRLLSVPSAEQLALEVEQTVQAMLHGKIPGNEINLQLILAASIQLPGYLRRVSVERRETPQDVIGVINDLRRARGDDELEPPPPDRTIGTEELSRGCGPDAERATDEELELLRRARQRFQSELSALLRGDSVEQRIDTLKKLFLLLAERLRAGGYRFMWQACAGFCDAIAQGGLELDAPLRDVLRAIDAEFRDSLAQGAALYARAPDAGLYRRLLEMIALSRPASALLVEVQQRHRLVPEKERAGSSALDDLGATSAAVKVLGEDLHVVLQRLETAEGDAFNIGRVLREVAPDLRRTASLLAGLGYRDEYEILLPQLERIETGLTGDGEELDDRLTEISAALLEVDQRLAGRADDVRGDAGLQARRHPLHQARAAVFREVQNGLEQTKQIVTDYVSSPQDTSLLGDIPQRLHDMAGALQIAELGGAPRVLTQCRDYLQRVVSAELPAPGATEIDALADALSSVEYFLERLVIDDVPAGLILDRASAAIARVLERARDLPAQAKPADALSIQVTVPEQPEPEAELEIAPELQAEPGMELAN
jgi:chemosensory pili system protein ChpA (sensor histidine kinase/response regulator)